MKCLGRARSREDKIFLQGMFFGICLIFLCLLALTARAEPYQIGFIPDTQVYSQANTTYFPSMTGWLSAQDVSFVIHLGDVVNIGNSTSQWEYANYSMSLLTKPYAVALGNHDYDHPLITNRTTHHYDTNFPPDRGATPIGTYGSGNNAYHLTNHQLLIVFIEFCPRPETLGWAGSIIDMHPEAHVLLVTHAYLTDRGLTHDNCFIYEETEGIDETTLTDWLYDHPRVFLTLNGHSRGDELHEHPTGQYSIMKNYQGEARGGDGYLGILEITPENNTIRIITYSPVTGAYKGTKYGYSFCANFTNSTCTPILPPPPPKEHKSSRGGGGGGGGGIVEYNWTEDQLDREWYRNLTNKTHFVINETPILERNHTPNTTFIEEEPLPNITMLRLRQEIREHEMREPLPTYEPQEVTYGPNTWFDNILRKGLELFGVRT